MSLKVESNIKELVKKLEVSQKAMFYAFRNTLNDMAFDVRKTSREKTIPRAFTLRNKWAENSIRVDKASTSKLQSETGTVWEGLMQQEKGASVDFSPASLMARSGSEKKTITKRNRMPNLQGLPSDRNISSDGLLHKLAREKSRSPFVITRHRKMKRGVYRFQGSGKNKRPMMIRSFEQKKTTIKKRPWLAPATRALTLSKVRRMFIKNAEYQVRTFLQ
jgi:hypothetical protein